MLHFDIKNFERAATNGDNQSNGGSHEDRIHCIQAKIV